MRFLFWFLVLAVAAVVVALAVKLNAGYAMLVAPPYRVELSLNLFLVLLVGGFFALYFVIRIITRTIRVPRTVRVWRRQQKVERARVKQDSAVVALLEGRYGKARQQAEEALAIPGSSGLNAIVAARAALESGFGRRSAAQAPRRAGVESRGAAPDAFRGELAGARRAKGRTARAEQAAQGGGPAHRGAAAGASCLAGGGALDRYSAVARPARQAQRFRRHKPNTSASARKASTGFARTTSFATTGRGFLSNQDP
jgi:HemY protein